MRSRLIYFACFGVAPPRLFMPQCKAGWYWSCLINQNCDRIVPHYTTSICSTIWAMTADESIGIMWSFWGLWEKCGHAVYSQWKCCIVGYDCNRIVAGFVDKPPCLTAVWTVEGNNSNTGKINQTWLRRDCTPWSTCETNVYQAQADLWWIIMTRMIALTAKLLVFSL